ncbi:MAG: M12 family metallo-peptidase [Acidobacteriota bacterium]
MMRTALRGVLVFAVAAAADARAATWRPVAVQDLPSSAERGAGADPVVFAAFALDDASLDAALAAAPREGGVRPAVIDVPRPDGRVEGFVVWESPVMEDGLHAWLASRGWPMKTYVGRGIDAPAATMRLDRGGPHGFHAMVLGPEGTYAVDPLAPRDPRVYASYWARDGRREPFVCETLGAAAAPAGAASIPAPGQLSTFRLAVAATGEYTIFHGGTQVDGQAAIVTTINRVDLLYEREFAVRLVLIANNSNVVFTDPATDPYPNGNSSQMLGENQATMDAVFGDAAYDIGHVFGQGGGGIVSGRVCWSGSKARGVSALSHPGDPFDIDYVAHHEMGHQFEADHTFDGLDGCCGANRYDSAAFEPGSASTVMAYTGLCGADNLQMDNDDMFHAGAIDTVMSFLAAATCAQVQPSGNANAPVVDAGPDATIPSRTPFELAAVGSDADGDALTYTWDEMDLSAGGAGDPLSAGDQGDNPILRTWKPTASSTRVFPRIDDLVLNTTSPGETLPTTSRVITFRVVARDNHPGGGLLGMDTVTLTSVASAGPFKVAYPNGGETTGGSIAVKWSVAGTNVAPIGAANVDVLLSLDGGFTYPVTLASGTANDGIEVVTLPAVSVSTARVKVKGQGNVFFDISDGDFTITAGCPPPAAPTGLAVTSPGFGVARLVWNPVAGATAYTVYRSIAPCPGVTYAAIATVGATTFDDATAPPGATVSYQVTAVDPCGESARSLCDDERVRAGAYLTGAGAGPGIANRLRVFDAAGNATPVDVMAYWGGQWGVNVEAAAIDASADPRILAGPGPGTVYGPHVRGFADDGAPIAKVSFYAYGTLRYGVNVAAAPTDTDAFAEIVTGAGPGPPFGPHVRGFDYDGTSIRAIPGISFFAYATLQWGVIPGAGDLDGDAFGELLTGPGPSAAFGAAVRGWNVDGLPVSAIGKINFLAFPAGGFGIRAAGGDADGDGFAEIVTTHGPGPPLAARVIAFDYDGAAVAAAPRTST